MIRSSLRLAVVALVITLGMLVAAFAASAHASDVSVTGGGAGAVAEMACPHHLAADIKDHHGVTAALRAHPELADMMAEMMRLHHRMAAMMEDHHGMAEMMRAHPELAEMLPMMMKEHCGST